MAGGKNINKIKQVPFKVRKDHRKMTAAHLIDALLVDKIIMMTYQLKPHPLATIIKSNVEDTMVWVEENVEEGCVLDDYHPSYWMVMR